MHPAASSQLTRSLPPPPAVYLGLFASKCGHYQLVLHYLRRKKVVVANGCLLIAPRSFLKGYVDREAVSSSLVGSSDASMIVG